MSKIHQLDLLQLRNEVMSAMPADPKKSLVLLRNPVFMGFVDALDPSNPRHVLTAGLARDWKNKALTIIDFVNAM